MNCPVCLSPGTVSQRLVGRDLLFETTSQAFRFSGCPRCHCLFVDPAPLERELEAFYPPAYWWTSSGTPVQRLEGFYRRLVLYDHVSFVMRASKFSFADRRRVRLLDVGCGGGTLLGLLQQQGLDVLGFDTAPEAATIAKTQSGVPVATGPRLHDSEFSDASFDMVSLFHVMEHVPDPRELLAEVRRILCHGGKVVLQVPNIESWQSRICGVRWHGLDVPRHVINYSTESMQRLLADLGFRIVRVRHFNLRDNAPAFASSLFPALDPGRRRVRQSRGNTGELPLLTWAKHALYLAVVAAVLPFAIAEALAGCGATLMVEAEKI